MAKSRHAHMKDQMRSYERSFFRAARISGIEKDPRRMQENADFHMIHENHASIANLPTEPINHEFRRVGDVPNGFLPYRED